MDHYGDMINERFVCRFIFFMGDNQYMIHLIGNHPQLTVEIIQFEGQPTRWGVILTWGIHQWQFSQHWENDDEPVVFSLGRPRNFRHSQWKHDMTTTHETSGHPILKQTMDFVM
jgi:hypothetical protein